MANVVFNPIDFLYYNPELQAYSNVLTIEDAQNFYYANNSTNLVYDTSVIPEDFDHLVFLNTNKDIIPISYFNNVIRVAMSNEGFSSAEIDSKNRYVTSIFKYVTYCNSRFYLDDNTYTFSYNNLNSGDPIKVYDDVKREYYFTVSNVASDSFSVKPHKYILYSTSNYLVDGMNLTDPLRIAKINLVRDYQTTYSNQLFTYPDSGTFNPTLYKILYPDAAILTDQDAYVDYMAKRKNGVYRINNSLEILQNTGGAATDINNAIINSNLDLLGTLTYGNVQITGINPSVMRMPDASNKLVTEQAIIDYVDDLQNLGEFTDLVIASNLTVYGPVTLSNDLDVGGHLRVANSTILTGAATINNRLTVDRDAHFHDNLSINKNLLVYGTFSVHGNIFNSRYGIGYFMDSNAAIYGSNNSNVLVGENDSNTYVTGSYVGFGTMTPTEKIHAVGNIKATSNIYAMNAIGIGLSNPIYQLQLSQDSAAKPSSTTWTVTSDKRLKNDIQNADLERCYDIVRDLPLKHFAWKPAVLDNWSIEDRTKLGWIAQDVEKVFPKSVRKQDMYGLSDCMTLDSDQLYAAMYGCIQKLQEKVELLEEENKQIKQALNII